jgi:hypothetical protein
MENAESRGSVLCACLLAGKNADDGTEEEAVE